MRYFTIIIISIIINFTSGNRGKAQTEFTSFPKTGPAPLNVQFTDQSTNNTIRWLWDFGDGTTSTERNPYHTYIYPDTFSIKLITWSDAGKDTLVRKDCIIVASPENIMILVPSGEFLMGDSFNETSDLAKPVHSVYVNSFLISKHEVTNEDYITFLNNEFNKGNITVSGNYVKGIEGRNYCKIDYSEKTINFKNGKFIIRKVYKNHLLVLVSWYGAVTSCNWKSEKEGLEKCYDVHYNFDFTKNGYRLLTEAKWEKAARGKYQRRYPWGNEINSTYANYANSGDPFEKDTSLVWPFTTPVGYYDGSKRGDFQTHDNSSPYGVYDMAGNVWEWCQDWFSSDYYSRSPYENPINNKILVNRIDRGGGYNSLSNGREHLSLWSAERSSSVPDLCDETLGFRYARNTQSAVMAISIQQFIRNVVVQITFSVIFIVLLVYILYRSILKQSICLTTDRKDFYMILDGKLRIKRMSDKMKELVSVLSIRDFCEEHRIALNGKVIKNAVIDHEPVQINNRNFILTFTPKRVLLKTYYVLELEDLTEESFIKWVAMVQRLTHYIKNSLMTINLTAQRLQMEYTDDRAEKKNIYDEYIDSITSEIEKLKKVSKDFLRFADIDEHNKQPVEIVKMMGEFVENYSQKLPATITIKLEAEKDFPEIEVDRRQIEMALTCIVENAVVAIKEKGIINISVTRAQKLHEDKSIRDYVVIEVQDTGERV